MPKQHGSTIGDRILGLLENKRGEDLTIKDVAVGLGIDRDTASKYLAILVAEGKIELVRQLSTTKLFRAKRNAEADMKQTAALLESLATEGLSLRYFDKAEAARLRESRRLLERKLNERKGEGKVG